ncbi:MAG: hypothetical protein F6J93_39035 [Oscillatoria sp. SIO1A7]|nr:hypothetical protein [Oscillatoria sp. SIO1A7]
MKAKRFDCIEMKRRGAERIYEKIKDMTPEEELAYWSKSSQEFQQQLLEIKQLRSETNNGADAIAKILEEWDAGEKEDSDRDVTLRKVKAEAAIAPDGKLTAEIPSHFPPRTVPRYSDN